MVLLVVFPSFSFLIIVLCFLNQTSEFILFNPVDLKFDFSLAATNDSEFIFLLFLSIYLSALFLFNTSIFFHITLTT